MVPGASFQDGYPPSIFYAGGEYDAERRESKFKEEFETV